MRCKKCNQHAAIIMRQHHLALCKEHFLDWFVNQTNRFINKSNMISVDDNILVAVSGGKDSLALWDVLNNLNYQCDGLYINLGINGKAHYSEESKDFAVRFANSRGLNLHIVDIQQTYGETISQISQRTRRGKGKPCAVCGLVKRHVMNRFARDNEYTVLVTGHNLDDEAAVLFGNTLSWSLDMLDRQSNVLPERPGFVQKVKPFFRFYERETAAYAILNDIPYIYEECPYSIGNKALLYKQVLNQIEEESPGTKSNFYIKFLKLQQQFLFSDGGESSVDKTDEWNLCPSCGQPTINEGQCAFCRTVMIEN